MHRLFFHSFNSENPEFDFSSPKAKWKNKLKIFTDYIEYGILNDNNDLINTILNNKYDNEKYQINFSTNLMNINIDDFEFISSDNNILFSL